MNTKFTEFVYSKLNKNLTADKLFKNSNILHGAIGLVGETQELLEVAKHDYVLGKKIDEELGDVLFYLTLLFEEFEVFIGIANVAIEEKPFLLKSSIDILELVKKYVFQERLDLHSEIKRQLAVYYTHLSSHFCIEDGKKACIEKLTKRYPDSFSPQLSKERKV